MLTTVELNDYLWMETDKIDNEAVNGCLATKVKAELAQFAQVQPQLHLLWCQRLA